MLALALDLPHSKVERPLLGGRCLPGGPGAGTCSDERRLGEPRGRRRAIRGRGGGGVWRR